jgi:hypothetical protein
MAVYVGLSQCPPPKTDNRPFNSQPTTHQWINVSGSQSVDQPASYPRDYAKERGEAAGLVQVTLARALVGRQRPAVFALLRPRAPHEEALREGKGTMRNRELILHRDRKVPRTSTVWTRSCAIRRPCSAPGQREKKIPRHRGNVHSRSHPTPRGSPPNRHRPEAGRPSWAQPWPPRWRSRCR